MPRKARSRRSRACQSTLGKRTRREYETGIADSDSGDERRKIRIFDGHSKGEEYEEPRTPPPLTHPLRFAKPSLPRGRRRRNRTKKQEPEQMEIEQNNDNGGDWFLALNEAHNSTPISRSKWHSGGRRRRKRRKSRRKKRRKSRRKSSRRRRKRR